MCAGHKWTRLLRAIGCGRSLRRVLKTGACPRSNQRVHPGIVARPEARLRSHGFDTLLIAGTATNVCCESSARDAMMLNFKVVMVSDALGALTDAAHSATLLTFYGYFGDVLTTDEAVASLVRGTSSPMAKIDRS